MKRILFALLFGIGLVLSACESSPNTKEAPVAENATDVNSVNSSNPYEIELLGGKKWEVEAHMMSFIREMEAQVKEFEGTNEGSDAKLAQNLHTGIDSLTSNCIMKGQAHDELHKWLLPYIDLVGAFAASAGTAGSKDDFEAIKKSFGEFNTYFE